MKPYGQLLCIGLVLAVLGATATGLLSLTTQNKPPPIKVGVLHSLSGTMAASEKPLVDAVRLAVGEINAQGGLLGRPLELVVADGRSDWGTFAAEAERLIVQERISVLFACWTSACRKAVKPVMERRRHLMFYPVQYEGLERSPNIVYAGSAPNQQIIPGARWAMDTFGKKIYLVGSDYIFPRTANRIIRDLASASGGVALNERYVPLGGSDFSAVIGDIRKMKPDVVLNTINGSSNGYFFRALLDNGLGNVPVVSFSVAEDELAAMGPGAYHPSHYAVWSYFQSLPGDGNRRFVTNFQARFGKNRGTSDPIEAAYNSVHLWANAVREAGTDAPEHVNLSIGRQSTPGPSGVIAVDAATRHVWKWMRIGHARANGQFDEVYASETAIRPAPFPAYRSLEEWGRIAAQIERAQEPRP